MLEVVHFIHDLSLQLDSIAKCAEANGYRSILAKTKPGKSRL